MENIKSKFEKMHGLPNCCGVVDTTHITTCLSSAERHIAAWFTNIVTGWLGSMKESSILHSSGLFRLSDKGKAIRWIRDCGILGRRLRLPPSSLSPYAIPRKGSDRVATRTLAKFKDTWKFLLGEMWRPDKHKLPRIIHVCCLLHNIVIDLEETAIDEQRVSSSNHDENYRQQLADENGVWVRDKLSEHLISRVVNEAAIKGISL
ncbi:LOW QUALITY PROTEIN: hypothetical protein U9M48_000355, partial [Paspalum notatum var. saurae]